MNINHRLRIATIFVLCLSLVLPATVPAIDIAKESKPGSSDAEKPTVPETVAGAPVSSDDATRKRKWERPEKGNGSKPETPAAQPGGEKPAKPGPVEEPTPPDPVEPTEPTEPTPPVEPPDPVEPTEPKPGDVDETPTPGAENPVPEPVVGTPVPAPDAGVAPAPAQPDPGAKPAPADEGTDTGGDSGARERNVSEPSSGLFSTPPVNPSPELQAQIDTTEAAIATPNRSSVRDGIRDAAVPVGATTLVVTEIVRHVPDWVGFAMIGLGLTALLSLGIFIRERRRRHTAEIDAMVDSLTGIPNRKAFDRRLDLEYRRASRYGRSLGLMVMDLDGFKAVNDVKGHAAGDAVLREVAQRLDGRMRDTDMVARIGGDEFAVICPETGINELMGIRGQLAEHATRGVQDPVGLSIGVAEFVPGDHDSASILARADESMYRVKRGERVQALV